MNIICLSVRRMEELNLPNVPGFNSFRAYPINTLSATWQFYLSEDGTVLNVIHSSRSFRLK